VPIDSKIIFELSRITKDRTIGVTKMRIFNIDILFHVVPNNFPIHRMEYRVLNFLRVKKQQ